MDNEQIAQEWNQEEQRIADRQEQDRISNNLRSNS